MAKKTPPPIQPTALSPPSPETNQKSTNEHRYYRFATPIAVVALFVSGAAAVFTYWEATLISQSNTLIRENNVISQRAFIYSSPTQTLFSPDQINPQAVNFVLSLTNSGNTATRNLIFFIKCASATQDLQEPWSILYQGGEKIIRVPFFIGPHAAGAAVCSFPMDQIQQMLTGKLHGYIMADITYHDRLDVDVIHKTHVALKLARIVYRPTQPLESVEQGHPVQLVPASITVVFEPRGRHNCADEECPDN